MDQLYINRLLKNPDAIVRMRLGINTSGATTIEAFLTQDFDLSASANWSSPFENFAAEASKLVRVVTDLSKIIPGGETLTQVFLGAGGNATFLPFATTIVDYFGTTRPSFSLDLVFIATDATKDPRRDLLKLYSGVFPTRSNEGIFAALSPSGESPFMGAPLGYFSRLGAVERGYVTLQIGRWLFIGKPPLIIKGVNPKISKAPTSKGVPLYVEVGVSLEFALTPSIDDVRNWFPGLSGV